MSEYQSGMQQPSLSRLRQASSGSISSMAASIVLDQTHSTFTNLDIISGRVIVRAASSTTISSIVVKLEGESRTRLLPPPTVRDDRPRPQLEFHKTLYKVQSVFPPPHLPQDRLGRSGKPQYTLPPGTHEYPFSFKIPFNNTCATTNSSTSALNFAGLAVELAKAPTQHVKKTLPPTLTGFPGEAEIRYFVKATVARPSILKENARAYTPFNFCPIEAPRPPTSNAETFARRKHQFASPYATLEAGVKSKSKLGLFVRKSSTDSASALSGTSTPKEAPLLSLEIRVPDPAILTIGQDLPLRILCTSLNESVAGLSLQSLEISIIHYTWIRAHDIVRTESSSVVMISQSNLNQPLNFKPGIYEATIDDSLWRGLTIPTTLPPTFETCNLNRRYELATRIGVRYEQPRSHPQYTTIELRIPFQLFSGIKPPPELLQKIAEATGHSRPALPPRDKSSIPPTPMKSTEMDDATTPAIGERMSSQYFTPPRIPPGVQIPIHQRMTTYSEPPAPQDITSDMQLPQSRMHPHGQLDPPAYSEAPPSYEDAIADNLPSVDADRRPAYMPVGAGAEDRLLPTDEKRGR